MTFDDYHKAVDSLPDLTRITSTFGYSGEGGYNEIWTNPDGRRWEISNGPWHEVRPFKWTVRGIS